MEWHIHLAEERATGDGTIHDRDTDSHENASNFGEHGHVPPAWSPAMRMFGKDGLGKLSESKKMKEP